MPRARKHLVCLAATPYYHVTSRCVRRAFLCGTDQVTGRSFEHRRDWLEDRIRVLSSLFSVSLCAYAVMSNHYHLVVKLTPSETNDWADDEVFDRWTTLFRGPLLVQRFCAGEPLSAAERESVQAIASVYRKRLSDLSWFMKCLNEPIARKANVEDGCTGHFWEARFSSQPLNTEQALFSAMAYVDLNPVRAKIAATPETSEHTSVQAHLLGEAKQGRLAASIAQLLQTGELRRFNVPIRPLMAFSIGGSTVKRTDHASVTLPLRERDYLQLVDLSSRHLSVGKRGRMDPALKPILTRLGLTEDQWGQISTAFKHHYRNGVVRAKQSA